LSCRSTTARLLLGYGLALILLFGSFYLNWSFLVFPLWVFLISAYILRDSIRHPTEIVSESNH